MARSPGSLMSRGIAILVSAMKFSRGGEYVSPRSNPKAEFWGGRVGLNQYAPDATVKWQGRMLLRLDLCQTVIQSRCPEHQAGHPCSASVAVSMTTEHKPVGLRRIAFIDRFLEAVGERDLFGDDPEFDSHWLSMLADAATISLGGRKLRDAKKLIEQMGSTMEFAEAPRHRAEADSRGLAFEFAQALTPVRL